MADRFLTSLPYDFSTNTAEPPTSNQIRLDAGGDYTTVTKAWFRLQTTEGVDAYALLMSLPVGSRLYLQDKNDHTVYVELQLTAAPIDKVSYIELPVTYLAAGTPLAAQAAQAGFFTPLPDAPVPPTPLPPGPLIVPPWRQPQSCYSVLRTPPTEEPITPAEAKLRAGMNWEPDDPREALLAKYIAAARNLVERETGLALLTQTREIYFWPYDPTQPLPLPSQSTPLQAISALEPWEPSDLTPVALGTAKRAMQGLLLPRVSVAPALPMAAPPLAAGGGAKMTIVAGWPDAAALLAEAPTLVQAVGLLVAHMLTLGKDLAITGAVAAISTTPEGYEACIAPHRLVWVA